MCKKTVDQTTGTAIAAGVRAIVFDLLSRASTNFSAMFNVIKIGDHEFITTAGVYVDGTFLIVWADGLPLNREYRY